MSNLYHERIVKENESDLHTICYGSETLRWHNISHVRSYRPARRSSRHTLPGVVWVAMVRDDRKDVSRFASMSLFHSNLQPPPLTKSQCPNPTLTETQLLNRNPRVCLSPLPPLETSYNKHSHVLLNICVQFHNYQHPLKISILKTCFKGTQFFIKCTFYS
jgi:hypothetical protein